MGEGGRDFLKEVVVCLLSHVGPPLVHGILVVGLDRCVNMGHSIVYLYFLEKAPRVLAPCMNTALRGSG